MGIIIHDQIETGFGFPITDSYASFHGQEVRISPVDDAKKGRIYHIASRYVVFKDKQACDENLKPIMTQAFRATASPAQIKDVYSVLYVALAKQFSHVDQA